MKIGTGFDVHKLVPDRQLIIGGVNISYERGLLGHSDADVLAHAIADALLGAAKLGDIGKMFPDSDPKFKDANSLELLSKVATKIVETGYKIHDVDSTIWVQEPKMGPHILQMRKNLANALDIDENNVGVKATTTEGLGYVGRSEGIAAQAVCLLGEI